MARKSDLYSAGIQSGLKDDSYALGYKSKAEDLRSNADNDAKLAQLIKGAGLKQEGITTNQAAADAQAKAQGLKPGTYSSHVSDDGYSFDPRAPIAPGSMMTPAQKSAEEAGGKAVETYSVSGGAPAMQKNLDAYDEVLNDLKNRDTYDRVVGGGLRKMPVLQSIFAPTEKSRQDKIQGAAIGNIKATDSNPAQTLIDQTLTRAYDASGTNEQTKARIVADQAAALAKKQQLDNAKGNYDRSGYVTVGAGPTVTGHRKLKNSPPKQDPLRQFLKPKQAPQAAPQGGTELEHLSDEELSAMAKKLGL